MKPTKQLGWAIVGGESGPGARPMRGYWPRSLRDQCVETGVPYHFKQWGEFAPRELVYYGRITPPSHLVGLPLEGDEMVRVGKARAGRELDGRTWDEMPAKVAA